MNIDYPHDIKLENALTDLQRRHYLPISEEEASEQDPKSAEERQEFLVKRISELAARFELAIRKRD